MFMYSGTLSIDKWIKFRAPARIAVTISSDLVSCHKSGTLSLTSQVVDSESIAASIVFASVGAQDPEAVEYD